MDLTIDSSVTDPRHDTRWRTSKHGQANGQPGTLDLTKFVEGTHYNIGSRKDNVIPSGVALQYNATSEMYEPWAPSDQGEPPADPPIADPDLAGYINDDAGIPLFRRQGVAKSTKAGFSLLLHGIIEVAYLPVAAQRAQVKTAPTTGSFIYV